MQEEGGEDYRLECFIDRNAKESRHRDRKRVISSSVDLENYPLRRSLRVRCQHFHDFRDFRLPAPLPVSCAKGSSRTARKKETLSSGELEGHVGPAKETSGIPGKVICGGRGGNVEQRIREPVSNRTNFAREIF